MAAWEMTDSVTAAITLATLAAFVAVHFLGLSAPWRLINCSLPISVACSLSISLPGWVFLAPFLTLLAIYAPALWTRVPYYPTSKAAYPLILAELPPDTPFTFIDIGCGMGDLLLFLSQHRPNGRFMGIEIGVVPYLVSKAKALLYGRGAITVMFRSVFKTPLSEFDYVYAFLSPAAMTQVWDKAHREMKSTSTFITNSFQVPEAASYQVNIKDLRKGVLFVHKMEERALERKPSPAIAR
ncbi:MAG: hypothetical protein RL518_929 [Pseudomonadota bacterium]|jgi:SAM-dependent methyltransferase